MFLVFLVLLWLVLLFLLFFLCFPCRCCVFVAIRFVPAIFPVCRSYSLCSHYVFSIFSVAVACFVVFVIFPVFSVSLLCFCSYSLCPRFISCMSQLFALSPLCF